MSSNVIRQHIVFTGYVQGVGFRWRARQAANLYGCTGWVHNEWDGSVIMEIQGTQEQIDQVIMSVEQGRYVQIHNMSVKNMLVDENENGFRTR